MAQAVYRLQDIERDTDSIRTDRSTLLRGGYQPAWVMGVSSEGGWHRIDKNGATITVDGSINTSLGKHTYFDDKPIYRDIATVSMSSLRPNQSMVKIPKFYYKRIGTGVAGDPYKLWVASLPLQGFSIHPAFMKNGSPIDCFYVGAYTCGGAGYDSQAGLAPTVSMKFPTAQSAISTQHGSGWNMWDIYQLAAIQMLALVELGSPDVQTLIGTGHSSGSGAVANGASNSVYRGIHELWGNVWQMVDGFRGVSGSTTAEIFKIDGSRTYVSTGITPAAGSAAAITSVLAHAGTGFDLGAIHCYGPSGATTWSDAYWGPAAGFVGYHGGTWDGGASVGLVCLYLNYAASYSYSSIGARLAKV